MLLQKIRDHAQGWFAYTIIGLLIIPFAVWGINYYFEGGGPMDAATVGGDKISLQDFQRAYQQQRQRLQAMLGDQADLAGLDGPRLKQQVLQQLIDERVLNRFAHDQGLRVGDRQLHDAIVALPVFQGRFDKDLYERLLRNQGYTPALFEEGLRQSLATGQLRDGVVGSALLTPVELEQLNMLLGQKRALQYLRLSLARYVEQAKVDDAAIQAEFEKNRERFVNPEQVQISFIELQSAKLAADITISEEQLKAAYQDHLDKYGRPEERQASHILVKLPAGATPEAVAQAEARARDIATSIRSGTKSFDQALQDARTDSSGQIEGSQLGTIGKGMFDSPAFETALFALQKPGDVSEPVRMPSGFHVIRLDGITPAQVKSFEDVRDAVAHELRQQQAENRFYEITQTLANLSYEHPDSLEPAAQALGVPVQESDWFSRQGGTGITAQPKVIESAFGEDALKRGVNSEPLEVEPGHVVVLRVREHQDATPRTLEQSREEIVRTLRERQAREALARDISVLKTRAAQGVHLQTLAAETGAEFKDAGLVGRDANGVDRATLDTAFRLPQPAEGQIALGTVALANGDQALLAVSKVVPGAADALPAERRAALAQQLTQQLGTGQFTGLVDSVRLNTKIVTHNDRL
jgi:peptidyl-prolyl cis-trans isomerase D